VVNSINRQMTEAKDTERPPSSCINEN